MDDMSYPFPEPRHPFRDQEQDEAREWLSDQDERAIDDLIEHKARELADHAIVAPFVAEAMDADDLAAAECLQPALIEILAILRQYREPVAIHTDAERVELICRGVQAALMPLARVLAETKREEAEFEYAEAFK